MVLRWLFHFLANNEQLINRLADSYPIRKTARFAVNLFILSREALGKFRGQSSILGRYEDRLKDITDALKKAKDADSGPKKGPYS